MTFLLLDIELIKPNLNFSSLNELINVVKCIYHCWIRHIGES